MKSKKLLNLQLDLLILHFQINHLDQGLFLVTGGEGLNRRDLPLHMKKISETILFEQVLKKHRNFQNYF